MSEITVRLPARPEYLHVLRAAVSSVAARLNFTVDHIDDLRMAVDEACSQLLAISSPADTLTIRMLPEGESLVIITATDAAPALWPPAGVRQTLAWQVLSALADDVGFERDGNGAALRLVKRGSVTVV